jgi:hypothetical protein
MRMTQILYAAGAILRSLITGLKLAPGVPTAGDGQASNSSPFLGMLAGREP